MDYVKLVLLAISLINRWLKKRDDYELEDQVLKALQARHSKRVADAAAADDAVLNGLPIDERDPNLRD